MLIAKSPDLETVFTAFRGFLTDILPAGVGVYQGQDNRVAEPDEEDFVVLWPISQARHGTNLDDWVDSVFTGSFAGNVLTITDVDPRFSKPLAVGAVLLGVGLAANTVITALGTGTGGVGTYTVNPPQTLSSRTVAAGQESIESHFEMTMQIDVHGPSSSDNAGLIATLFYDERAVTKFEEYSSQVVPLYADDPRQMPFINGEQQVENRWIVEAHADVIYQLILPQEFMDSVEPDTVSVEAIAPI